MAEKPASKPKPASFHSEFGWFIWGLVGLAALWFFSGGPDRDISHKGAYLKPPAPLDSGIVYGNYYAGSAKEKTPLKLPEAPGTFIRNTTEKVNGLFIQSKDLNPVESKSFLTKTLGFDGVVGMKNTKSQEEYVRLVTNDYAKNPVVISGLLLQGNGFDTNKIIPKAVNLLTLGVTALKEPVSLPPGSRALITSGRSPVGTSFRENMCTGYLDQFQTYTPNLYKDCPSALDELKRSGPYQESSCVAFVKTIPQCRIYQGKLPDTISSACSVFVTQKLNYNACALDHKTDSGFYKNDWRLFLDSESELWKNKGEIIRLIDERNNTVDAVTY